MSMLQELGRMPEPLRRQILLRLGISLLFLVLMCILIAAAGDIYLWIPCAGASVCLAAAAFLLFRRVVLDEYVVVCGECSEVGLTPLKRRAKYLIVQTETCKLKVMLQGKLGKISTGAEVSLYIAKNTSVYEQNGLKMLYTYIAITVK